jgi:hypothetical protein
MNRVVGGAAHHCASPGAAERIQDWVLGGVAADTDRRSFGARRPHASRSHQHTTYAEPLGGVGGRREQEGRVLAIAGVDTAPGRVRPEANPLVDATSTRGREPPHHQEITHIDKEKTKKRSKELDNCGHIEGLRIAHVVSVMGTLQVNLVLPCKQSREPQRADGASSNTPPTSSRLSPTV